MMQFWWEHTPPLHNWDGWDTASLLVTVAAFLDWMPRVAAFLAVVVWGLRIAQDPMVKGWFTKWRNRK